LFYSNTFYHSSADKNKISALEVIYDDALYKSTLSIYLSI